MTQLRIRRKPEIVQRSPFALVPMAAVMAGVLAAGIGTTFFLESGKMAPTEAVEVASPQLGAAFDTLQGLYLKTQAFTVNDTAWVVADHPPVTHFDPGEMAPAGTAGGWNLRVNTVRGLSALSGQARRYDRLYLDLGHNRYQPLRWRHVP